MSSLRTPPPRAALDRGEDGKVHATAHPSSLVVDVRKGGKKKDREKAEAKGDAKTDPKDDRAVDLTVTMPKSVRKALRKRAEEFGWTAEEAAAHVLRVWAGV